MSAFDDEILRLRTRVIGLEGNLSMKTAWTAEGWHRAAPKELAAMKTELSTVRRQVGALLAKATADELGALAPLLAKDNLGDLAWLQKQAKKR
jgi:hypothetical protein